jgi:hypothetical protein
VLRATTDFPPRLSFKAYLHADEPFDITAQEFKAMIPRITQSVHMDPANILSEAEWTAQTRIVYWKIGGIVVLLVAVMASIWFLTSRVRSWIRIKGG